MTDSPEWFAPKPYGFGAGLPISWQGWLVVLVYLAVVGRTSHWLGHKPLAASVLIVMATAVLVVIAAKTTRGGWRWRWGNRRVDR